MKIRKAEMGLSNFNREKDVPESQPGPVIIEGTPMLRLEHKIRGTFSIRKQTSRQRLTENAVIDKLRGRRLQNST